MQRQNPLRFLSTRVKILLLLHALLGVSLAAAYALTLPLGAPAWPLIAFFCAGVLLAGAYWGWVLRPYRRLERMIALFLDGYTLSGIGDAQGIGLTRATERLIGRIHEEFSAAHLLKISKRQAQYRALQNQINPHFLYNTLESIRSEALIAGLDSVADMTEALAVFFRYTISKVETLVSVEEELQNCETYFRIQQYRFGDRLSLSIECGADERAEIYRCRLPKLTLQPILENSILHGTEQKISPGHLVIRLERTQDRLLIQVSDDGVGMNEKTLLALNERLGKSMRAFQDESAPGAGSIALSNVNNRIRLIFGEEYGLHIHSMAGLGTDVNITLPMITSDREVRP